jgi:2,3-bisphosphoglycerate-independent phosphoglycerate mutase
MPDHPTPVSTQGHTGEAVPFAMMGDGINGDVHLPLGEHNAAKTGIKIDNGYQLMEAFLK